MRYFVRSTAKSLELTGYVKNLDDGRVKIIAEGEPETLEKLLETIKNGEVGHITGIETHRKKATGEFGDFRIER
ncbi:MAG: acylphosphatase [Clostridia bacterium]|nr:acylphosphatase [Clostridia bacterium]